MFWGAVTAAGLQMGCPDSLTYLVDYGLFAQVMPLVWLFSVLALHRSPELSEQAKRRAFYSGIMVIVLLVLGFIGDILISRAIYAWDQEHDS